MSCTLFYKPGDLNDHRHFLSPLPEVSGGIATPERSKAERDVPRASSGHCTAYTVLGSGSGTETQGESLLEINHLFVLNTVPNVAELREQVRFYFGWDPKKQRQHVFDVVAVLTTGERIAFAIKPEFRLNSSNQEKQDFEDEMRVVAWWAYQKEFVDDVRILTEVDLDPIELHNAKILTAVREADPEADVAALQVLSTLPPEGGQPLQALTCEMLGVILTAGAHVNLKLLSDADWNIAGHAGFGFARRGKAGVEEALRLAKQRFDDAGLKGGPQKALGRLYQWLQFSKNGKPLGPVREIVRNFVLDNFSIEVGADLLGQTVDRRRVHSVHSLAKQTGDHPKTVNRALVLSGLIDGDPDKVCGNRVFDADAAEALMQRVRNSIPVTELPTYLNCNRVQAQQFVRSGLIPKLVADNQCVSGKLKQVAVEDVDAFLVRFMAAGDQKQSQSDGVMDVVAASEVARWPVLEIVNGILAGSFATVEIVDVSLKFKGVLVDPHEIREVLARGQSQGRVGLDEAARIVGMPKSGVSALVKLFGRNGETYVREYQAENSKGAKTRLFNKSDLEQFRSQHISLKQIAADARCASKSMKMRLDAEGVDPIASKNELGRVWYRRCDVSGF